MTFFKKRAYKTLAVRDLNVVQLAKKEGIKKNFLGRPQTSTVVFPKTDD